MDDSGDEVPYTSARGSSVSGSRSEIESSAAEAESDSELSDAPKAKKGKTGKSGRPALKKIQSGDTAPSGGNNSFLTAAERRAKERKEDKKTAEDPFEFLRDVRDVSRKAELTSGDKELSCIYRKMVIGPASLVMTQGHYTSLRPLGRLLRPSRSR